MSEGDRVLKMRKAIREESEARYLHHYQIQKITII